MKTAYLVFYTAVARGVGDLQYGMAPVLTDGAPPSYADCLGQIPGFVAAETLAEVPRYFLLFTTDQGPQVHRLTAMGIAHMGPAVIHAADRDEAWAIAVRDELGNDVTRDFACFRGPR